MAGLVSQSNLLSLVWEHLTDVSHHLWLGWGTSLVISTRPSVQCSQCVSREVLGAGWGRLGWG